VATIAMDPLRIAHFILIADDQPDMKLLGLDQRDPDKWIMFVGCATRDGRDMLESEW
jgi:hypothetical protein